VEIGAWKGKSTAWLVEGAHRHARPPHVVSIDPHQRNSWEAFRQTVEQFHLEQRGLQIHRALSHEVGQHWRQPIALLWVDGCHEYEAVATDIDDFVPHVLPGGWVVFDDAAGGIFPGVEQAIDERLVARPGFERVATIRHLQIFRRQG
jgi:predicted O-methyltransferase YrrM